MSDDADLPRCECDEGEALQPAAHHNRPGLDAIRYRLATHNGFLQRMRARLDRDQLPEKDRGEAHPLPRVGCDQLPEKKAREARPLARLTARDPSDPTMALLDAWASVADVLTFYQERIANEGFLRTAAERRSVLELARTIGYELKPGVAASTVLAFTADGSKDSPREVNVPKGTRVQSVPAKDELPQTFETLEAIVARPEWNALQPYTRVSGVQDPIARSVTTLRLKGTATGLRAGDAILIVGDERRLHPRDRRQHERWDFRILERVEPVPEKGYTRISFSLGLGDQHPTDMGPAAVNPLIYALRLRAALFGHSAPEWDRLDPAIKARLAPGALDVITSLVIAADGKRALCAVVDGTVRSWDLKALQQLSCMQGHVGSVNCVALSPDGCLAISGGDDGTVRVWEVATGRQRRLFAGHSGPVTSVVCGAYQEKYNPYPDEAVAACPELAEREEVRVKMLAVSAGVDASICVWTLDELAPDEPALVRKLTGQSGRANSLALHLSGEIPLERAAANVQQYLVCGGEDGVVRLWRDCLLPDALVGPPLLLEPAHRGAVAAVALSSQESGLHIASGGLDGVKLWQLPAGSTSVVAAGEFAAQAESAVTALTFAPNGERLLLGRSNGTLQLLDRASGKPIAEAAEHTGPVLAVGWSQQQARIMSGGGDRRLYLFNSMLKDRRVLTGKDPRTVSEWPGFELAVDSQDPCLELDSLYPGIVPNSWIVLARPGYAEAYYVKETEVRWLSRFSVSAKITQLRIDSIEHVSWFGRRNTTVYAQSEPLELYVEQQLDRAPLHGASLELATLVHGLQVDRRVVVSGQRMRARIESADIQWLTSADGYTRTDVVRGDLLVCVSPPAVEPAVYELAGWEAYLDGFIPIFEPPEAEMAAGQGEEPQSNAPRSVRWHLRDRNGVEGYISTAATPRPDGSFQAADVLALRPKDKEENKVSEALQLARIEERERTRTSLHFREPLQNLFDHEHLSINANVAPATHGETVSQDVLGSGDGTAANQRFTLRKKPVTHVTAANASGGASTLEVHVNRVLWQQVQSLHDLDARSQSYVVRRDDELNSTIVFGDGVHGARLPTGQENVTATYRVGLGPQAHVPAGSIKLLQTKPLGIREVINPIAATGAAAPESLEDARSHAPLTVLTFERVVSLQDYEDFAGAFAGIGKALVTALWSGTAHCVHLTLAAADGQPLADDSLLKESLTAALQRLRDPAVRLHISGYALRHFGLTAKVKFDPRFRIDDVRQDIRTALGSAFSFERRNFGQPVTRAEVTSIVQQVAGVLAVNVTSLVPIDESPSKVAARAVREPGSDVNEVLIAERARWIAADGSVPAHPAPAQLLLLHPDRRNYVDIREMQP